MQDVEQKPPTVSKIPKPLSTPNPAAATEHSTSPKHPPSSPPGAGEKPSQIPQPQRANAKPQGSAPQSSNNTQKDPRPSDGNSLESSGKGDLPQAKTVAPSGKGNPPAVTPTTPVSQIPQPTPAQKPQQTARTDVQGQTKAAVSLPLGAPVGSSKPEQGWEFF